MMKYIVVGALCLFSPLYSVCQIESSTVAASSKNAIFSVKTAIPTLVSIQYWAVNGKRNTSKPLEPLSKEHVISIGELEPSTTYFYRVFTIDKDGKRCMGKTKQFRT